MKIQEVFKIQEIKQGVFGTDLKGLQKEYDWLRKAYGTFCPMPVQFVGDDGDDEVKWHGPVDFPELEDECARIKELYYLIQDLKNKQDVSTDADTDPDGGFSRFDTDF